MYVFVLADSKRWWSIQLPVRLLDTIFSHYFYLWRAPNYKHLGSSLSSSASLLWYSREPSRSRWPTCPMKQHGARSPTLPPRNEVAMQATCLNKGIWRRWCAQNCQASWTRPRNSVLLRFSRNLGLRRSKLFALAVENLLPRNSETSFSGDSIIFLTDEASKVRCCPSGSLTCACNLILWAILKTISCCGNSKSIHMMSNQHTSGSWTSVCNSLGCIVLACTALFPIGASWGTHNCFSLSCGLGHPYDQHPPLPGPQTLQFGKAARPWMSAKTLAPRDGAHRMQWPHLKVGLKDSKQKPKHPHQMPRNQARFYVYDMLTNLLDVKRHKRQTAA